MSLINNTQIGTNNKKNWVKFIQTINMRNAYTIWATTLGYIDVYNVIYFL